MNKTLSGFLVPLAPKPQQWFVMLLHDSVSEVSWKYLARHQSLHGNISSAILSSFIPDERGNL